MPRKLPRRRKHVYFQPRVVGGRDSLPSSVLREVRQAVEEEAYKHRVSRSFVIACILAKAFDIDLGYWYENASEDREKMDERRRNLGKT